ncbi:hypothetical protein EG327_001339 [Venturia inaequalis]|uniref:Uncharacterized protein n=1 Tax=Venturia inaequalis TaxID=5025 RepID=A0A8H3ZFR8_VENIN|nr:hypothetical protein EG327_001339 [Venturia inaequalis]
MKFLSITAVLLNLVLVQDVAAVICDGRPARCHETPCNALFSDPLAVCNAKVQSLSKVCGDRLLTRLSSVMVPIQMFAVQVACTVGYPSVFRQGSCRKRGAFFI